MKKIKELREKIKEKTDEMTKIVGKAEEEKRNLNEEEVKKWGAIDEEVKSLEKQVEIEERQEELTRKIAAKHIEEKEDLSKKDKRDLSKYSFIRAIGTQLPNAKMDGLEAEMHQEALREAANSGIPLQGLGVPSLLFNPYSKRAMNVTTTTAGGHLVQTTVQDTITALRPRLFTESLGATMLTGLVGNIDIPRNDGVGTATWEGEADANAETTPTLDKISLSPNRLGAYTEITKQITAQAQNESMEQFVRSDLEKAIRIAVDYAAINGLGSGNQPKGILPYTGIGSVVGGNNGAAPDWADIVGLETAIAVDNADLGALAYLSTPGIRGKLKTTEKASSTAQFIWGGGIQGEMNGYAAYASTQVPSTLSKGTSTGVCHAIIFGNWNDLIIANWAGLDIVVDPYSLSKTAKIQLVVNSWWDIDLRHPESFAAMQDALIS